MSHMDHVVQTCCDILGIQDPDERVTDLMDKGVRMPTEDLAANLGCKLPMLGEVKYADYAWHVRQYPNGTTDIRYKPSRWVGKHTNYPNMLITPTNFEQLTNQYRNDLYGLTDLWNWADEQTMCEEYWLTMYRVQPGYFASLQPQTPNPDEPKVTRMVPCGPNLTYRS